MEKEKHRGLVVSIAAEVERGRWAVNAEGKTIGHIQESIDPTMGYEARIEGFEGYIFPNRWAAAYAVAYGHEARQRWVRG